MKKYFTPQALLACFASFFITSALSISTGMLNGLFQEQPKEVAPYAYLLKKNTVHTPTEITKQINLKPRKPIPTIDVNDWATYPVPSADGSFESYEELFKAVSNSTGVSVMTLAKMAALESGFQAGAKAKCPKGITCGAKGLFQFIDGTWDINVRKHGKTFNFPANPDPMNPVQNTLMAAMMIRDNTELLQTVITDREITDTDLYLVHFLGRSGAVRFFTADSNKLAAHHHRKAASSNFNIFYTKKKQARTFDEVYALLDNRMETRVSEFMN